MVGDDPLYALSTVENLLRKYTFDGSSWLASGSIGASGAANLAGFVNDGAVSLFLTSGTTLFEATDSSGYNATIAGTLSTLATAGPNTAFRGIGLSPAPSARAFGLLAAGVRRVAVPCRPSLSHSRLIFRKTDFPPHRQKLNRLLAIFLLRSVR